MRLYTFAVWYGGDDRAYYEVTRHPSYMNFPGPLSVHHSGAFRPQCDIVVFGAVALRSNIAAFDDMPLRVGTPG